MISQFIRSNYSVAVCEQKKIHHDTSMINAIQNKSLSNDQVIFWMNKYKLFQGIIDEKRSEMAQEFIQFLNHRKPDEALALENDFKTLHTKLYFASGNRKCLSATSKLLWCMYPYDIVIYDAFVARAILVLQGLDIDLLSHGRFLQPPQKSDDSTPMTNYYLSYSNLVLELFNKNKDILTELRTKHLVDYKYDIRIFDKLLWMMGNYGFPIKLE